MFRAKVDFLWFVRGDSIEDEEVKENWKDSGLVESVGKVSRAAIVEPVAAEVVDSFIDDLRAIDGIGKKTAKDIAKVFPNKVSLVSAIGNEEELPFRDDVVEKLKEAFDE